MYYLHHMCDHVYHTCDYVDPHACQSCDHVYHTCDHMYHTHHTCDHVCTTYGTCDHRGEDYQLLRIRYRYQLFAAGTGIRSINYTTNAVVFDSDLLPSQPSLAPPASQLHVHLQCTGLEYSAACALVVHWAGVLSCMCTCSALGWSGEGATLQFWG